MKVKAITMKWGTMHPFDNEEALHSIREDVESREYCCAGMKAAFEFEAIGFGRYQVQNQVAGVCVYGQRIDDVDGAIPSLRINFCPFCEETITVTIEEGPTFSEIDYL